MKRKHREPVYFENDSCLVKLCKRNVFNEKTNGDQKRNQDKGGNGLKKRKDKK